MTVEFHNKVCAPESLNLKFFQEVLENGLLETRVSLTKVFFEMGSRGGDNYCSQIYRVRLTFERDNELDSVSVIVKSIPKSDSGQFLEDLSVFLKEKIFYYNVLPRMEILLDRVKFGPKMYHTAKEPINTLVFEDLVSLGYVMADREEGLNLAHCQMVMKKLGQLHGISLIINQKDPKTLAFFQCGIMHERNINGSPFFENFFSNNLQGLITSMSNWKGYESITEKLKRYSGDIKQNLINSQLPIPGELKVLNHGDLWVNNFMFKYNKDDQKLVEDVIFVDFQMSIYGSPGYDLNYFLNTSVQLDVLKEKREDLLKTYHTVLCETLKAHSYKDVPSFKDILAEVRRREIYGFSAAYGLFPAIAMDKTETGDNTLDNFMDDDVAKKKVEIMFSSKRLVETLKYTLKRFDELGVLD